MSGEPRLAAEEVRHLLGLEAHPEGGWFRQTFRHQPPSGGRGESTAIYYLLAAGEHSRWHRLFDADEVWLFHAGDPLELALWSPGSAVLTQRLGNDLRAGEQPQWVVPRGVWQSARPLGEWTLVSCTVAPAFEYGRWELAEASWEPSEAPPAAGR
ncbi:MAG TPA: cupin domain-containing protein [Thermoanaerobaculia bacterium]|nr:cupin domain-containing protein [Thermoanaerobaculia bacterium]